MRLARGDAELLGAGSDRTDDRWHDGGRDGVGLRVCGRSRRNEHHRLPDEQGPDHQRQLHGQCRPDGDEQRRRVERRLREDIHQNVHGDRRVRQQQHGESDDHVEPHGGSGRGWRSCGDERERELSVVGHGPDDASDDERPMRHGAPARRLPDSDGDVGDGQRELQRHEKIHLHLHGLCEPEHDVGVYL